MLSDTARWYQTESSTIAPERLDEVLANRPAGVRQIRMITIVDAQGIQRATAQAVIHPPILTCRTVPTSLHSETVRRRQACS